MKVVYGEDVESYYAEVFDKKTGEFLTRYGVYKEAEVATRSGYTYRTVYEDVDYGAGMIDGRLSTRLIISGSGSFAQIEGISSTWWSERGAGVGELINDNCDSMSSTGSFPTLKIETDGSAVCKVAVDVSTSTTFDGSVTIKMLVDFGFSQSYSAGGTIYFTKSRDCNYTYRLY